VVKSSTLTSLAFVFVMSASSFAAPAQAQQESCGIVHKQGSEKRGSEPTDSQRFWLLAESGFIDMDTCLVWSIDVHNEPVTLSEAMGLCAELGKSGPYGADMGWQLPTVAELTSLDGKEWEEQGGETPPITRSDTRYWTNTPWLGIPGSWAVVQFSGRTTVVNPLEPGIGAGVWCVSGFPAKGLR
jgi:hypothetical protein